VLVSFGRKYVYLTPAGKLTRWKYEPYCEIFKAFDLEPRPKDPALGYQVWAPHADIGADFVKWARGCKLAKHVRDTHVVIGQLEEWRWLDLRARCAEDGGKPLTSKMRTRFAQLTNYLHPLLEHRPI
jgi:hypothetical protein